MNFDGQHEDEEVLFYFRQHPVVMRKQLLIFLVLLTVGFVPWSFFPFNTATQIGLLVAVVTGLAVLFYRWISWYYSLYIVTGERFIQDARHGLFDRQVMEIDLVKIQSVNYEVPGFQATLYKYGTIVVQTFVGDMVIEKVYNPGEIHQRLTKILRDYETEQPIEEA